MLIYKVLCVLAVLVFAGAASAFAIDGDLVGQASVVDGDTLVIRGTRVRLAGIDAPQIIQLCRDADRNQYRCGTKAADDLDAFLQGQVVSCKPTAEDRYHRMIARCSVDGRDLGDWLVRHGLALDYSKYSKGEYADAQAEAKTSKQGIWVGSFVEPWQFRACIRTGGSRSACSDGAGTTHDAP